MSVNKPRVLNVGTVGRHQTDAVFIGRGSKWGNPYRINIHGDRDTVIEKYRVRLMCNPPLLAALEELRGKNLLCYCAPKRCHGDILLQLANRDRVSR